MSDACRSCGAPVLWLRNDTTGRTAPVDAEPAPEGNCRVDVANGTYTVLARVRLETARRDGEPLHRNHFTTCPQAGRWAPVSTRLSRTPRGG